MRKNLNTIIAIILFGLININVISCATNTNVDPINISKNEVINIDSWFGALTVKDDNLYVGTNGWSIFKINEQTKTKEEIINLDSSVYDLVTVNDKLYARVEKVEILEINQEEIDEVEYRSSLLYEIESNKIIESMSLEFAVSKLVASNNKLYFATIEYEYKIYQIIFSADDRVKFEEVITLDIPVSYFVFKDNQLYAGTFQGEVYQINIEDKTKTKIINVGSKINSLVFKGETLYIATQEGKIYQVNIETKVNSEIIDFKLSVNCLVFKGETLYLGTNDYKIYRIDFH